MDDRLNILIAEDESLVAEMIRGMLEELGHGIAGIASAAHATSTGPASRSSSASAENSKTFSPG